MDIKNIPSPNFNERAAGKEINMLVLHYTGMLTAEDALDRMCDSSSEVSAHYMVDEDGEIYQLVDETKRAWHAGVSFWKGETDINSCSIGIEIVNPGHEFGYREFPEKQMQSVIALSKQIVEKYPILSENVVGHSDIAPTRKQDPGELFDWKRLAESGIGLWPNFDETATKTNDETAMLENIGYDISDPEAAKKAFHLHYGEKISVEMVNKFL